MGNNRQAPTPNQAAPAPAPVKRLGPIKPITIPNQVVGSTHAFFGKAPFLIGPAKIATMMIGSNDFELSTSVYDIQPGEPARDLEVGYHPRSHGTHRGELTFLATWADGHVEKESTSVVASARELDEPPLDAITTFNTKPTDGSAQAAAAPVTKLQPTTSPDRAETQQGAAQAQLAQGKVETALLAVASQRQQGVTDAAKEAAKFLPAEAPSSIWWDIALLAITLGTAGAGGVLAMAIEDAVKNKMVAAAVGLATDAAKRAAAVSAARAAKFVSKVSEGALNRGVAAATAALKKPPKPASADGEIAFFSEQSSALVDANEAMTVEVLSGLARVQPMVTQDDTGIGAIGDGIKEAIDSLKDGAKPKQHQATALQFMEYQARTNMGTEKRNGNTVSAMADARKLDHHNQPKTFPGLLELYGEGTNVMRPFVVTHAKVNGVAKSVAAQLNDTDLRRAGIPIRFHIEGRYNSFSGMITRDEAGTVRYSNPPAVEGALDSDSKAGDPEAQSVRSAERIVNQALAKTLTQWGVEVETDGRDK